MKHLASIALLLILPATMAAQRIAPAVHFGGRSNLPRFAHHGDHAGYYPIGLFDPFYSDYFGSTGYPAASQPPVIVLQSPASNSSPDPAPVPAQPLMIELQGDRYVQINGEEPSRFQTIDQLSAQPTSHPIEGAPRQAGPAILIFRDGRRQEVSSYTIADGVLYAASDYATTGKWTQKIELTSLSVPDTIAENKSRNIRFQFPKAANEVIVGP